MMLRAFLVIVLLVGLAGGAYYFIYGFPEQELARVSVGERTFYAEVADTPYARAVGLSGRDTIGSDGMLFIFDEPTSQCFWMKDTRFPLDILFIADGSVKHFDSMEENTEYNHCPPIPVTHALELPAFSIERYNIRAGDPVRIILPGE